MRAFLYISTSCLVTSGSDPRLRDLVQHARSWNHEVGITGALIATERHFVQFIEGPHLAIIDLIGKLREDRRHKDIHPLLDLTVDRRAFAAWDLAYSGADTYVDDRLAPILDGLSSTARSKVAEDLMRLLRAMSRASQPI